MKNSHKLSDAIHILVYLHLSKDEPSISSKQIAESVATNPGVIRRLMSQLSKEGLIETKVGAAVPKLSRNPEHISLFDIFTAVEDGEMLKVDEKTNMSCPVGKNIQSVLTNTYSRVQNQAENEMKIISLQEIIDELIEEIEK